MSQNALRVRFRAYAPNGAALGILPHPLSWEAGLPLNDMSSLTMTYPDGSDAANILKSPCEVALELQNPKTGNYNEYAGCRFINIKRSSNLAQRPRVLSFTMPSYGWQLKKVRWLSKDNTRLNKENRIVYKTNVGPGLVLKELLDEAKNRQNIPGMLYTFNGSVDSAGQAWTTLVSGDYDLGQDAWSVIDAFARQGIADWWFNQREFEIFKPDTFLRRTLDTDTGINVHSMLSTSEEPVERTWEENAGHLLVIGDTRTSTLLTASPSADLPWGDWDEAFSASGVTQNAFLNIIGQRMLQTKYKSRAQFTKRLIWTEGAPVPLAEYRQGDFIRAMDDTGSQKAAMRIHQITLSGVDPYGVSISLTLNDRFTDRALQTERWVSRITGGGGPVGGGGTGAGQSKPPPPAQDSTPPKVPVAPSVQNTPYFSDLGDPVAMADVSFEVVTEDILNNDIDVSRYNVAARRSDHNFQQARVIQVPQPSSPSTGQRIHGLVPLLDSGFTYYFSVQAIRQSGYGSDWTSEIAQVMAYPTEAPEIPSAPILSTKLSTVKAEWNGLDEAGQPYDAAFREVQVEASTNNSTWFHVGDIFSPGSSVILSGKGGAPTWNVGQTVYVRFRARNSAAVISGPSAVVPISVLGVTGPDIAANTITANNIQAGTITAEQIKAHSLSVDSLAVGNPNNMVIDPGMNSAGLNAFRILNAQASSASANVWSITSAGRIRFEHNYTATNNYSRFNLINNVNLNFPTQSFPGPTVTNVEHLVPVTRPISADGAAGNVKGRFTITVTGWPASPGSAFLSIALLQRQFTRDGVSTAFAGIIRPDQQITANGTFTYESPTGADIPAGVVGIIPYFYIRSENSVSPDVAIEISDVEIWQENSVFIGDGRISAPLIQADAIDVTKLKADAITSKHSIRSAYYEMVSQSGAVIIKITENANYSGQSGIRWDGLIPAGGSGPRVFQVDSGGSGGWDPRGFVLCGPEQITNSSGRVDLQFAYGIANTYMKRSYGTETISVQGIFWDTSIARFRIGGMFNTGHYTNDMIRFDRLNFQNGTYTYGAITTRQYYPILCPNAGTTPVTSSIQDFPSGTTNGFRYVSSAGTDEVFFILCCGTP